ncbi:MAG: DUF952 domain-containing protein [Balneolaceae bacterium]
MSDDLIFHFVSKRKWKDRQKNGFYQPEAEEKEEDWIPCCTAVQAEEIANKKFAGRKTIYMLVINTRRLSGKLLPVEKSGKTYPVISNRINLDAIIDKILIEPNEKGLFEIKIEVK